MEMVKKFVKRFCVSVAIVGFAVTLISWGGTGHTKISNLCSLSFNSEMSEFNDWVSYIRNHASDADYRKIKTNPNYNPNEQYNHYLDIELFTGFTTTGKIDQTSYPSKYNGILPWATESTFNYLKNALTAHEWDLAKQYAADLGHYVGDGHMPLHITYNYDGDETGQSGIHSRYEGDMIDTYNSQISYSGDTNLVVISNVNQYIFDYIYANHKYVDSVLNADTYAKTFGSTSSSAYKQALWNKTKGFTIKMFKNASHALAELIYTAWVQAGKPSLISTGIDNNTNITEILEQNYPNPFTTSTKIKYNVLENSALTIRVTDIIGKNIAILYNGSQTVGSYEVEWTPQNQPEGIYFVVLDTQKEHKVRKMLLVK